MNRWQEKIYDYYIERHPLRHSVVDDNHDTVYNLVHSLYTGVKPEDKELGKVFENESFKLYSKSCRGRIDRTLNFTDHFLSDVEKLDKSDNEIADGLDVNEAKMFNHFASDGFKARVHQLQDAESKTDSIIGVSAGRGGGIEMDADDVANRARLMERIATDVNLKKMLDYFGTFYAHMSKVSRERWFPNSTTISDVTTGDDIQNILNDELVKFAVPELEMLAMAQYATKSLLQFEMGKNEDSNQGGVVIALDISESMTISNRFTLSCAMTMAIYKWMNENNRPCEIVLFNESTWPVKSDTMLDVMNQLSKMRPNGGTRIGSTLSEIFTQHNLEDSDVLLITDAEDSFSPATIAESKSQSGARLFSIVISGYVNHAVKEVSDGHVCGTTVDDFKNFSEFVFK